MNHSTQQNEQKKPRTPKLGRSLILLHVSAGISNGGRLVNCSFPEDEANDTERLQKFPVYALILKDADIYPDHIILSITERSANLRYLSSAFNFMLFYFSWICL